MTRKSFTYAATGLVLIAAAVSARADLTGAPAETTWSNSVTATAASPWDAWGQPPSLSEKAFALASNSAVTDGSARASAASLGSMALPSSSAATLWTFVTSVRAQQRGDTFSVLETNLSLVEMADALPPSQVPLPAAAWCLLMGLLGMAGVRLTGCSKQRADHQTPVAGPQPLPA